LLIPAESRLLELEEVRNVIGTFDREKLCYPWWNPDPLVDELQRELENAIQEAMRIGLSRQQVFAEANRLTSAKAGWPMRDFDPLPDRATIPYLTEPWYC